ncbi:MAG: hypothetical protein KUG80_02735 [Gammaproteobacteria bacterium]|nr:hypothetical protein [Gammaproteobacteria bacterium]
MKTVNLFFSGMLLRCISSSVSAFPAVSDANRPEIYSDANSLYFAIGGGKVSRPLSNWSTITMMKSKNGAGFGYSCGKFDPHDDMEKMIKGIKNGSKELPGQIQNSANAAIMSLPGFLIKRNYPSLYGILVKTVDDSWRQYSAAAETCERMETEVRNGNNPYGKLVSYSMVSDWKVAGKKSENGTQENNDSMADTKVKIKKNAGVNGLAWIDAVKYGKKDSPLDFSNDLVVTGYNMLIGRVGTLSVPNTRKMTAPNAVDVNNSKAQGLVDVFSSPLAAQNFVTEIIGSTQYVTDPTNGANKPEVIPGKGAEAWVKIREEELRKKLRLGVLQNRWNAFYAEKTAPLPRMVIDAIQSQDTRLQDVSIDRLSFELAVADFNTKIVTVKRLIRIGLSNANVQASDALPLAKSIIYEEVFPLIDDEVKGLRQQQDSLASLANTMNIISNAAQQRSFIHLETQ